MVHNRFKRSEIQQLLANAKRVIRLPFCDILLAPALVPQEGRLLVITPARVGTAPQRNTVRRRFKALFHTYQLSRAGYDCAIIVKKAAIGLSSVTLLEYLKAAYAKMGYIFKNPTPR